MKKGKEVFEIRCKKDGEFGYMYSIPVKNHGTNVLNLEIKPVKKGDKVVIQIQRGGGA